MSVLTNNWLCILRLTKWQNINTKYLYIIPLGQKAELTSKGINEIRRKLTTILKGFFEIIKLTVNSMSKILYLTMLLLIFDAMNYMRKYYSDDSFDNNAIDGNLKSFWEKEKKSSLTPLRNWELTSNTYGGKYHMAKSLMITYDETIGIILAFIPVLISASFIMAIYFADVSFATVSCCKSIHLCYCKSTFFSTQLR